jgi:protein involved in polysaccharide export with SLBB domain
VLPNLTLDSAASKIILKPYDQVFVRRNPSFEMQQNIEIKGLIRYPGLYPRLSKSERLSSYIERAGGIVESANLAGAVLYRTKTLEAGKTLNEKPRLDSFGVPMKDNSEKIATSGEEPVSIDLYKALKNKNSKDDIVLQKGDVIYIPEINPFVSIEGAVQSPVKITYDKDNPGMMYYIDKAGGFGVRPWRKRIYVTYASGKSRRTKSFLFIRNYPKVEEGSVVTVPVKPQGQEIADVLKTVLLTTVPAIITGFIIKAIN